MTRNIARMHLQSGILALVLAAACAPAPDSSVSDGGWIGTTTTEDGVTTVVTASGSVWGGTGSLVEEASIGVESGPDEYMLGRVTGAFATDDLIIVVDAQLPRVRVYDNQGIHVRDLGGAGEGPGEYSAPVMVTGGADGRIYVYDTRGGIRTFSKDGEALETWSGGLGPGEMVVTDSGTLWAPSRFRDPNSGDRLYGVGEFGPDGLIGQPRFPSEIAFAPIRMIVTTRRGNDAYVAVPFAPPAPRPVVAPSGAIIVGAADRYRIETQSAEGTVLAIENQWAPVPVVPEEADWHRRLLIATLRAEMAPQEWTWDGSEIPASKPAFNRLLAAASGEIWVVRPGQGEQATECISVPTAANYAEARTAPCWRDVVLLDVFDPSGRYLGDVAAPEGIGRLLHVDADTILSTAEDEAGTIMVKRYRLILPEEEQ